MDAQQGRQSPRQYRLQRQWHPTHKQPHRHATGNRMPIARQPRAWYAVNQIARKLFHNGYSGRRVAVFTVRHRVWEARSGLACGL